MKYLFETLDEVREQAYQFLYDQNGRRPHESLDGLPPNLFRQRQVHRSNIHSSEHVRIYHESF
jgi:hypothetical protein